MSRLSPQICLVASPALLVFLAAATAHGDEPLPVGSPITAPGIEPAVTGLGYSAPAKAGEPGTLFVNFNGAKLQSGCGNNSKQDCSQMAFTFGGEILPFPGDAGLRAAIVQAVRQDAVDFNLASTDTRPADSVDYAMVLVGDSAYGGSEYHGFAGVAPTIDCGNSNPNITSFALAGGNSMGMSTVIHQEAAHTWGLEHVNKAGDNLFPTSGGVVDPQYTDECMKIVKDTMLNPTDGYCNSVHTQFCSFGNQNSYQEMLWLFGPGTPDTIAPEVAIDFPSEGANVAFPVEFDLTVTMSDNESPQVMATKIYLDDSLAIEGDFVADTLKFPVSGGISEGQHTFRVETSDEDGNPATDEVTFTVSGAGGTTSETSSGGTTSAGTTSAGTTDSDSGSGSASDSGTTGDATSDTDDGSSGGMTDDASGCSCTTAAPPLPLGSAGLFLLGLARRRRRRD